MAIGNLHRMTEEERNEALGNENVAFPETKPEEVKEKKK